MSSPPLLVGVRTIISLFFLSLWGIASANESLSASGQCQIFDIELSSGKYVGACLNGKAEDTEGKVFDAQDRIMYQGGFKGGKKEGWGKKIYSNGDVYTGYWKDDQRSGLGAYVFGPGSPWHGDSYDGSWERDKKEGFGTYRWVNGEVYSGPWKLDRMYSDPTSGQARRALYARRFLAELPKTQAHVCATEWHPELQLKGAHGTVKAWADDRILVQLAPEQRGTHWQLISNWRPCPVDEK